MYLQMTFVMTITLFSSLLQYKSSVTAVLGVIQKCVYLKPTRTLSLLLWRMTRANRTKEVQSYSDVSLIGQSVHYQSMCRVRLLPSERCLLNHKVSCSVIMTWSQIWIWIACSFPVKQMLTRSPYSPVKRSHICHLSAHQSRFFTSLSLLIQ